ncbi:hypothetical protein H7Y63_03185 [Polaromonas sp.]|nr:hypothetical protein [Candidatus Saccharibacteria bacterium]
MNRSGQTLSTLLATLGTVKILLPVALLQLFALDKSVALFGVTVAVIAFGVWFGPLKFLSGSSLTQFLGLTTIIAGILIISSPTLLGMRGTYLPIADIFVIIESGILLQIIGLERKQPETLSPMVAISAVSQLLHRRVSRPNSATHATISH